MKSIVLFLLCFIFGVILIMIFYTIEQPQKNILQKILSPVPSPQFSVADAPKESLKGTLTFSGNVDWQSRVATEPARLINPVQIQQGESVITDATSSASLEIGNTVIVSIFSDTRIDIVQTLPVNFVFTQNQGTATYLNIGNIPVSVRSFHLLLQLQKGTITVSADPVYSTVAVNIASGSAIAAFNDLSYTSHTHILSSGSKYIFNDSMRLGKNVPL